MKTLLAFVCFALSLSFAQNKSISSWKVELPEDIQMLKPIDGGTVLFLWSDEYAWTYETGTGKKIWSVKIDDYSNKAPHELLADSLYLVADGDSLFCFNILRNGTVWKKIYPAIEQGRYSGIQLHASMAILSYRTIDLAVDLATGKELWRSSVEYQSDLRTNGTVNSIILGAMQKQIVFTADDEIILSSLTTGKRTMVRKESEPNGDLIKQKRQWYYLSPDESVAVVMLKKGVLALNLQTGKELNYSPLDIDENYNVFMPTAAGCFVIGSEKLIHMNFSNGKKTEWPADVDDLRNIVTVSTDSGMVAIISLENKLVGLNAETGKAVWQTPEKYPMAKGFIHSMIASRSNSAIVTYLDPSDDLKLYVMNIDALTGKIRYRTLVAHADESLPKRELPLKARQADSQFSNDFFGFGNAGFRYSVSEDGSAVRVLIHTAADMMEPNTDRDGGEGYVIVDSETGAVVKKHYMKIAYGLSFKGGFPALAPPLTYGSMKILPGNKNLVAIDTTDASLKWMLIEQDVNNTCVVDMAIVDSLLLLRTGGSQTEFQYDEKKKKVQSKTVWEDDEYSLIAVNANNGRLLWKKQFDDDPAPLFPMYALARYMPDQHHLLTGSEKFLTMQTVLWNRGDSLQWKFEFSDSGVGAYSYEDLFNPSSFWKNEPDLTVKNGIALTDPNTAFSERMIAAEPYATGVSRVLQVAYHRPTTSIIAVGDDGIASVNPENGKKNWLHEWSYSSSSVSYRPVFFKDHLFYFIDGKAELLNLKTGKITYGVTPDKESGVFLLPNGSGIVFLYKDEITCLLIPQ